MASGCSANGQCSQCTHLIDRLPRKSCIVPLAEGMQIRSVEGVPELLQMTPPPVDTPELITTDVLILGAGPAGMAAALELGGVDIGN